MGLFESIGNWIDSFFDFLVTSSNSDTVKVLTGLVSITITLQIIFKSFQYFAGKSNEPVRELVWDMSIKLLVIGVALNLNGYLDLIKVGMQNLHDIMSGDMNLYAQLDEKLSQTVKLVAILIDKFSVFTPSSYPYIFAVIGVIIGFGIGIIPSFLVVITTGITLKILMMVLPIVIYVWIYPWFKNVFTQWMSLFIGNLLTVFIVGTLFTKFIEKYGDYVSEITTNADTVGGVSLFFNSVIMGILLAGLMKIAVEIAKELGSASIERLAEAGMGGKDNKGNFEKGTAGAAAQSTMRGSVATMKGARAFVSPKGR